MGLVQTWFCAREQPCSPAFFPCRSVCVCALPLSTLHHQAFLPQPSSQTWGRFYYPTCMCLQTGQDVLPRHSVNMLLWTWLFYHYPLHRFPTLPLPHLPCQLPPLPPHLPPPPTAFPLPHCTACLRLLPPPHTNYLCAPKREQDVQQALLPGLDVDDI